MVMPLAVGADAALVTEPTDSWWELLGRSAKARGDAAESVPWSSLIKRHERRVVVALLARGVPIERAKELSQEAWLRLMEQHRSGKLGELRLPGIAIKQAIFLAKDQCRRQRRLVPLGAASEVTSSCDVERQIFARQQLRCVEGVLARCSPRARRIFHLLYGQPPNTPAQVARMLGLSLQRVRQIMCELRKRMRDELEACDD